MTINENLDPEINESDDGIKMKATRPKSISEFVGQGNLVENLKIFINASKIKEKTLDHVIFHGPPGLGKTTLANIVAKEAGVNLKVISGPLLSKTGDLAAILTNLNKGDVLFIDEIHRMTMTVEEVLYSAMEDFRIDVIIGEGPSARTMNITLDEFTVIGATTRLSLVSGPLRDRFGISLGLSFYSNQEMQGVLQNYAIKQKIEIEDGALELVASRSRGTPRIGLRLLDRIHDFALHQNKPTISLNDTKDSMLKLEVFEYGLDKHDILYLRFIIKHYNGGPAGLEAIAAGASIEKSTVEDVVEPFLTQIGFIKRTSKGRVLSSLAMDFYMKNKKIFNL